MALLPQNKVNEDSSFLPRVHADVDANMDIDVAAPWTASGSASEPLSSSCNSNLSQLAGKPCAQPLPLLQSCQALHENTAHTTDATCTHARTSTMLMRLPAFLCFDVNMQHSLMIAAT